MEKISYDEYVRKRMADFAAEADGLEKGIRKAIVCANRKSREHRTFEAAASNPDNESRAALLYIRHGIVAEDPQVRIEANSRKHAHRAANINGMVRRMNEMRVKARIAAILIADHHAAGWDLPLLEMVMETAPGSFKKLIETDAALWREYQDL